MVGLLFKAGEDIFQFLQFFSCIRVANRYDAQGGAAVLQGVQDLAEGGQILTKLISGFRIDDIGRHQRIGILGHALGPQGLLVSEGQLLSRVGWQQCDNLFGQIEQLAISLVDFRQRAPEFNQHALLADQVLNVFLGNIPAFFQFRQIGLDKAGR